MKKLFLALTVAGLGTMLVSVSAQAGGVAFDAVGNLLWSTDIPSPNTRPMAQRAPSPRSLSTRSACALMAKEISSSQTGQRSILKAAARVSNSRLMEREVRSQRGSALLAWPLIVRVISCFSG